MAEADTTVTPTQNHTRLPAELIGKPSKPLKLNTREDRNFYRLAFTAAGRAKTTTPCWNAPAEGGYFGGYETGEAMANSFLKYMRDEKGAINESWLASIAESFMVGFEREGGTAMKSRRPGEWSPEFDSFRGQVVGFMNTVQKWLVPAAKHLGGSLDRLSHQDMVDWANSGLGFDSAAYWASLSN